ncbi:pentatricopeptide repeat-containing protein At3g53360, mitochondrial [Selaginella moellendorffii]|nr:pentatricopeptide repeat-containing protein At3g53360, mitochondrial [Selaginella moellendorffii]|eukprot:XP_024517012.1 pentatricopeptide repeat-containing protein At3g53360, mitochondrial [Selaginella moellendorffii]
MFPFNRKGILLSTGRLIRSVNLQASNTSLEQSILSLIAQEQQQAPDPAECARLIIACKNAKAHEQGKFIHGFLARHGLLHRNPILAELLLEMYIRCGSLDDATQTFDSMPERDLKSWSRMITANAQSGNYTQAFALFQKLHVHGVLPNQIALVATLNSCLADHQVRSVHECAREIHCEHEKIVATALLNAYGKCGDLKSAGAIFRGMEERDLISWTALITGYAQFGHSRQALDLYREMLMDGVSPSRITFLSLLSACTKLGSLREASLVHDHIRQSGNQQGLSIQNGVVCMYHRCGSVENAKLVFDAMPRRDVISWTSMIAAYAQSGSCDDAIRLYRRMELEGEKPNKVTFLAAMEACAKSLAPEEEADALHRCVIESGLETDVVVATALVNMYGKSARTLGRAQEIFDGVEKRDNVVWNALIAAYAQHGCRDRALDLLEQMQRQSFFPDKPAFVSVLSALTGSSSLALGRSIHAAIADKGFESDSIVRNALMNMYGKCGCAEDALRLFEASPRLQNVISWNTVIAVHAQNGEHQRSMVLFHRMQLAGVSADRATLLTVLYACTNPAALRTGRLVREVATQRGYHHEVKFQTALVLMHAKCETLDAAVEVFESMHHRDTPSWNAMVAAYGYHGNCDLARRTFDDTPDKNLASWNSIIAACSLNGRWKESFKLLQQMQVDGAVPDTVTLVTVLSSCAAGSAIAKGRAVHRFAAENGLMSDVAVANGVVDFYGKCGCLLEARAVLDEMAKLDEVTWNSLLAGYAQHGYGVETLEAFTEMQHRGYSANRITFMSVLHACSHVGLVAEGCKYFSSMIGDYGFQPIEEHCGCMIDLLGRAGHLSEAKTLLARMPFKPNLIAWMSLLGSCKVHGNLELGRDAALKVLEFDPENAAAHMLLSEIVT